jgi:hypothetical protein
MAQAAATAAAGKGQERKGVVDRELSDLLTSLERDPEVQAGIDGLPLPSAPNGAVITYRDPEDVTTIRRLSWAVIISLSFVLAFAFGFIYMMLKKPILIVQDRTSGETLFIDGREVGGRTASLSIGPEELTEEGKTSMVKHFLENLYNIDPANRAGINKAIRMMDPDAAVIYSQYLRDHQVLETQALEEWQTTWKLQDVTIDERDPYIIRAIGEQTIRRKQNGTFVQETRQLSVKLLITVSATVPKRNDNNYNTGFCISKFKVKALNGKEASPVVLMSEQDTQ